MEKNSNRGMDKKKHTYVYTMEYYSVIKRSEIESSVETCMDLKTLLQMKQVTKRKNII